MTIFDFVRKTVEGLETKIKGILNTKRTYTEFETPDVIRKGDTIIDWSGIEYRVKSVKKMYRDNQFYSYVGKLEIRYVLAQGQNKQYGVYDTTKKQLVYDSDSFDEALQTAIDKIEGE